mmetsp:Transcript_31440/g.67911  ORF Transcript_31440/g.67911 Transcript_31440/m.67911 type:complete len:94 (+) Transcript_31440:104-385(+)
MIRAGTKCATRCSLYSVLGSMLEHPATPRHKVTARQGYMPLHRSVERGHVEVSQMLLGAGAIVNASSCVRLYQSNSDQDCHRLFSVCLSRSIH